MVNDDLDIANLTTHLPVQKYISVLEASTNLQDRYDAGQQALNILPKHVGLNYFMLKIALEAGDRAFCLDLCSKLETLTLV